MGNDKRDHGVMQGAQQCIMSLFCWRKDLTDYSRMMPQSQGCILQSVMHLFPLYESYCGSLVHHDHAKMTNSTSLSDQCLAGDHPVWGCKSVL